ncbi:MAG TPA: MFS transporter [Mycobacteriales bacterium]|nr:MFS transporter [Mycobacteriales bacterium]
MADTTPERLRDTLLDRLTDGYERHAQRWHLQLPDDGDPSSSARPLLVALGLPTFGLAFAMAMFTTYGPVVLLGLAHSPASVGALIGGEGAFALVIPIIAGVLSDRLPPSTYGRRLPFVLVGGPMLVVGLVLLPFSPSYFIAGAAVLIFFIGYYLYYPPYRALYADVLPRTLYARAQASQGVLRGVGLGAALIAGGLLLSAWKPLPFVIAGGAVLATTLALGPVVRLHQNCSRGALDYEAASVRALLSNRRMLAFALANALWELSFAGLKSFIVLYVVKGLHHSTSTASAVIAVVAVAYVAGAPIAGRLADRYGVPQVMLVAATVYGLGLCIGTVPTSLTPMVVALPFVAMAGAILLTLPPALAFMLAPNGGEGAAAGLLDLSRGVGVVLGPVLVGAAVTGTADGWFAATNGYAAMWPLIGLAVLLTLPILRGLRGATTP